MKYLLSFFYLALALQSFSQKIKVNEVDKFTKQKRIETSVVNFKGSLTSQVGAYLRSVDSIFFICLKGTGIYSDVISGDDKAIFLLDNDSTVSVTSTGMQSYEVGTLKGPNAFTHQYHITKDELNIISQHDLKSVRRYGSSGYIDIDVPERNKSVLKKAALLIIKTINE